MDFIVDKVFIINLDKRVYRMENMKTLMDDLYIKNWERFPAIRPKFKEIGLPLYSGYTRFQKLNKKYVKGSVGCKLSHLEVLKIAKDKKYKRILILEDDVVFEGNMKHIRIAFKEMIDNFRWDMFYLGLNKPVSKEISDLVFLNRVQKGLCTHAYIVNGNSYNKIINILEKSNKQIDITYQEHFNKLNCFTMPNQFRQNKSFSDINRSFF